MSEIAEQAGASRPRGRHFPNKRDLFAAIYQRPADDLLAATDVDPELPLAESVTAGLDAHIDSFTANRHTVLAANRTLSGDPVVQGDSTLPIDGDNR
jgi:AcrR family transcriptional regulator